MSRLRGISVSIALALLMVVIPSFANENSVVRFDDVPEDHWAYAAVNELRTLGITDGIGHNRFGLGLEIKRSEFVTYLVRLMKWETVTPEKGSFTDNVDPSKWYYPYVETAYRNGVIPEGVDKFRPEDPITREEMAIMLVNALGYGGLAQSLNSFGSDFDDVSENEGYITIAKDFGIIKGVGDNKFKPYDTARREEAAVMMMRMYEKISTPVKELHAFYAIRSYPQINYIPYMNSVSFGWSRMEFDCDEGRVVLNTASSGGNDFYIPEGFTEPFNLARESNVSAQLMVYADNNSIVCPDGEEIPLLEYILTRPELRKQAVSLIAGHVNNTVKEGISISFDGAVIDFESMKGERLKNAFNDFLRELKQELDVSGKKLYVAVHPKRIPGREYYDAYDYKTIGQIADRVILMAHDYYAKKLTEAEMKAGYVLTPLTPEDELYYALKAITDRENGVSDPDKILLQISFDSVQWNVRNGEVLNDEPLKLGYDRIYQKLSSGADVYYYPINGNPYMEYTDETGQVRTVIWYENSESVSDKIRLAKMFGVNRISLWRLGIIPDYENTGGKNIKLDIWQSILNGTAKR